MEKLISWNGSRVISLESIWKEFLIIKKWWQIWKLLWCVVRFKVFLIKEKSLCHNQYNLLLLCKQLHKLHHSSQLIQPNSKECNWRESMKQWLRLIKKRWLKHKDLLVVHIFPLHHFLRVKFFQKKKRRFQHSIITQINKRNLMVSNLSLKFVTPSEEI